MEYTYVFWRVTISDRDLYNRPLRAVFGIRVSTHAVLHVNHKKRTVPRVCCLCSLRYVHVDVLIIGSLVTV